MNCFVETRLVFRLEFMFKTTFQTMFKTMFKTMLKLMFKTMFKTINNVQDRVKKKYGIRKNAPIALVERFDILMASKVAGNAGVRN